MTQAGSERPARVQLPGADQIGILAVDRVVFVALLGTLATEVVDEAVALLALVVVGQARRQLDRQPEEFGIALPAQLATTEAPVQLDNATAGKLPGTREGQKLFDIALPAVDHERQFIIVAEPTLIIQARLVVANGLAGVEGVGARDCLAPILAYLRLGQSQRILGLGLIQAVDQQREAGGIIDIPAQSQIGDVASGLTVITIAVGAQARDVGGDVQIAVLAAVPQARAPQVVRADGRAIFQGRVKGALVGEALDDAARGIAVQRGKRAAQYLDTLHAVEVEE